MIISFSVAGNAVPKQAFRYRAGKGRSYQPARVKAWEEAVGWAARQAYSGEPLTEKLVVTIEFHLTHKRKVDADNLQKGTADSLHGIVFVDDCQIVEWHVYKIQPALLAQTVIRIESA